MAYKTIFGVKPKKENKKEFCRRIVNLLDDIAFCDKGYGVYKDGRRMLDVMFKYNKFNNGYISIDDILNEADNSYTNIFDIVEKKNIINEEDILVNIDLIVNCLNNFVKTTDRHFYNENDAIENIAIIFKASKEYLLKLGYKLFYDENKSQFLIIENEIAIDIEEITEEKIRTEVENFYDYKNSNDIDEKKKIMLILIGNLESRKNDIANLVSSKIADTFSNYANNFNLRHNNISPNYKKYFNKEISELTEEEILKWYDYIFAFMLNIYLSLEKLKDVNINNGYK